MPRNNHPYLVPSAVLLELSGVDKPVTKADKKDWNKVRAYINSLGITCFQRRTDGRVNVLASDLMDYTKKKEVKAEECTWRK